MHISKKQKYILAGIILVEIIIGIFFIKIDMSAIAEPPAKLKHIFGFAIPMNGINISTILNTWLIMVVLILSSWKITRHLTPVPSRLQVIAEQYVSAFDKLCEEVLGSGKGRKYMPMVSTLFIFILVANSIGAIPSFWHIFSGFPSWLKFDEPTKDLNTTLGFGLLCFLVAHISGIYYKGFKKYLSEYFEPMIEIGRLRIPNLFMGMLNIVGEFGKTISHSFRLFGNMLGSAIIILVISNLTKYIVMPVFLNAFFGLFIGAIQAFVFAMLALVYVSVMINE